VGWGDDGIGGGSGGRPHSFPSFLRFFCVRHRECPICLSVQFVFAAATSSDAGKFREWVGWLVQGEERGVAKAAMVL
jgi:hypothetical protein